MDKVASAVGLSPEEFRRRNFIHEGETTATSQIHRQVSGVPKSTSITPSSVEGTGRRPVQETMSASSPKWSVGKTSPVSGRSQTTLQALIRPRPSSRRQPLKT